MLRAAICFAILSVVGAASASAQDAKVLLGEKVYAAQKCAMCHSIAGKGNKNGPLDEVGSKHSDGDLRAWMTEPAVMTAKAKSTRKPLMKAYKLPKDDLDALVAYMMTLKAPKK